MKRAGILVVLYLVISIGLSLVPSVPAVVSAANVNVLMQHNDLAHTGANLSETTLNTSNVNVNQFGKLFSRAVDGQIYAQPLYVSNLNIGGGTRNVIFVATQHNSVYAFDADDPNASAPLWHVNFGPSAPNTDYNGNDCVPYKDIDVEIGITSTPVIDLATKTMYVVPMTKENGQYFHRLHALDITTGADKFGGPTTIQGSVPGTGNGSNTFVFDSKFELQRMSLVLSNGNVYFGFGSYCDVHPYTGWIMGYNATTLAQTAIYASTPNGQGGGIWQAGQGPSVDANGILYFMTGNGDFDADTGGSDLGTSFIKLAPGGTNGLTVQDWFTPFNQAILNVNDMDLGASGVLLIPNTNLMIGGGKEGKLYILNRSNLGHYNPNNDNQIVQSFQATAPQYPGATDHIHGSPIYWNGPNGPHVYIWGESDFLRAFKFIPNGQLGTFQTTPDAISPHPAQNGMPGGMMSLSANGGTAGTGIIWASHPFIGDANTGTVPGMLLALDASDVSHELWTSKMFSERDDVGNFAKFAAPTVANGRVYLPTFSGYLHVYGLLSSIPPYIVTQPANQVITSGGTATLNVAASTPTGTSYQWYQGTSGNTANPVAGATSSTLTTPTLFSATSYWVRVTNSQGHVDSNTATVSVNTLPNISTQPASQNINSGQTATLSVTANTNNVPVNIRINSGGPAVGNFSADNSFSAGFADTNTNSITTTGVTNAAPAEVYQSERWADNTYTVQGLVPNTSYTVRLHFAENVFNGAGQRLFNVFINGTQVLTNFDIFAAAGGKDTANVQEFTATSNSSGQILVHYAVGSADNPKSSGLEVLTSGSTAAQTYQWYQGSSGDTSNPINGATGSSFTTPALTTTTSYWVRISNAVGSVDSNTAVITIGSGCQANIVTANTDNGNGACGSLSFAINQANAAAQFTTITLNTPQITLTGPLPALNNPNVVVKIDGGCTVQNSRGVPGTTLIAGAGAGNTGVTLQTNGQIRGLALKGFSGFAAKITGNGNQIVCSWLGTANGTGSDAVSGSVGLQVGPAAHTNNTLGQAGSSTSGNIVVGKNALALQVLSGGHLVIGPGNIFK
jgi:hypothetical protein